MLNIIKPRGVCKIISEIEIHLHLRAVDHGIQCLG